MKETKFPITEDQFYNWLAGKLDLPVGKETGERRYCPLAYACLEITSLNIRVGYTNWFLSADICKLPEWTNDVRFAADLDTDGITIHWWHMTGQQLAEKIYDLKARESLL